MNKINNPFTEQRKLLDYLKEKMEPRYSLLERREILTKVNEMVGEIADLTYRIASRDEKVKQ